MSDVSTALDRAHSRVAWVVGRLATLTEQQRGLNRQVLEEMKTSLRRAIEDLEEI